MAHERRSTHRGIGRRSWLLALMALVLSLNTAAPALADTSVSMGVTVTTQDAGYLEIGFAEIANGYTFRNAAGQTSLSVTAVSGDTATATIKIAWNDTRTESDRVPFAIELAATDFQSTVNPPGRTAPFVIPASSLTIQRINGIRFSGPAKLDNPTTVYVAPAEPPAGDGSLMIVLRFVVPPSTFVATYVSTLQLQVMFGDDEP